MIRRFLLAGLLVAACTEAPAPPGDPITSVSVRITIPAPRNTLEAYCLEAPPIECSAWVGDARLPECHDPLTGETCYRLFDQPQICVDGPRIEIFDAPPPPAPQT